MFLVVMKDDPEPRGQIKVQGPTLVMGDPERGEPRVLVETSRSWPAMFDFGLTEREYDLSIGSYHVKKARGYGVRGCWCMYDDHCRRIYTCQDHGG